MSDLSTKGKPRLYLASPLFNDAEKNFNSSLKEALSAYFDVYLPQEDGGLLLDMVADGLPTDVAARYVFAADINALNDCNVLLIVLDGRVIDEGAAFELGYAYAKGKPCFGLKTDPRQLLPVCNNPMIDESLVRVFPRVVDLIRWAVTYVVASNGHRHKRAIVVPERT